MVCLKGMWGNFDDKENKAQNICLPAQSLQSLKPKQKKLLFFSFAQNAWDGDEGDGTS